MNERIKELAQKAKLSTANSIWLANDSELERFAELVRQDEANGMRETYMKMIRGAVLEEREACAKLCDDWGHDFVEGNYAAKTIRARSEPSPAFKNYMGDNWAGIV